MALSVIINSFRRNLFFFLKIDISWQKGKIDSCQQWQPNFFPDEVAVEGEAVAIEEARTLKGKELAKAQSAEHGGCCDSIITIDILEFN